MAFDWKPPKKPGAMTSTSQCKSCGGTDFDDFCESGDRACSQCGTVLQENGIVSTVQFSESGGSSNVVGQFVSGDKGRPGGGGGARGRGRFGYSRDSRDITIQNGKKKIMQILAQLHLRHSLAEPAGRLFSLCVNQNYVQGRKTINIVAACVYIVCRQQNFPIMLIDISDKLAVNVYILGKTFQKLIKYLNLQTTVPIVDPAMYIKRFAAKLDLGNKTNAVCMTALKIIGSMKRDFLATGRQPAGVCCAALTLATRVNRIERSKEEIRKAVNVCDATVRKRLLEFEATPTSQLTVEELNKMSQGDGGSFPGVGDDHDVKGRGSNGLGGATGITATGNVPIRISEVRMDPPAFIANRIRDGQLKTPWTKPITPPSKHAFDRAKLQAQQANGSTTRKKKSTTKKASAAGVTPSSAKEQDKEKGKEKGKAALGCTNSKKRELLGRGRESVDVDGFFGEDEDGGGDEGVGKTTAALAAVAALEASVYGGVVGGERSSNEGEKKKSLSDGDGEGCAAGGGAEKGGGKGKGKGKPVFAEDGKRKRVLPGPEVDAPDEEESEEEEESEDEEEEEDEEESEDEELSEGEERSEDDNEEDNGDRLAFKINDDANTDEAREALTRHVLRIRGREHGAKAEKSRAKRKKVENQMYSCLESMFDEDEKRARGEKDPGRSTDAASMASALEQQEQQGLQEQAADNGAKTCDAEGAGGAKAGDVEGEAEVETEFEVSGGAGSSSGPGDKTKGSAAAASGGGQDDDRGMDGSADGEAGGTKKDDWEMYLRTAEDQERTKTEWETENKDWLEDQEEKMRILAEEGGKPGFPRKKRKYNVSPRTGTETFGEVLQSEAAKNKSLKIDHAALQRVMNLDGSLKQIGEGDGDDDESMEEVEEGDPAPPIPLPRSVRGGGRGFRGGRVKNPLTASPSPSSSTFPTPSSKASAPASATVSKNLPPSKVEDKDPQKREPAAMAETKVQPWARKAPDDGGEEAIKDALALLTKGGMSALTGSNAADTLGPPAVAAAAASSSVKKAPEEIVEEELEEIEEASGGAAAGKLAEDVEDDDDGEEEDEEDDEGIGGGLYGGDDYDDDDPYGEEA